MAASGTGPENGRNNRESRGSERETRLLEALEQSRNERDALIASLHDLVFLIDRDMVYRRFYAPDPDLLLVNPGDLVGQHFDDVGFPEPAYSLLKEAMVRTLDTGRPQRVTYWVDLPGGRRWFDGNLSAVRDLPGLEGGLVCSARDITERVKAQEELEDREKTLQLLTESAPVGLFRWTLTGQDALVGLHCSGEITGQPAAEGSADEGAVNTPVTRMLPRDRASFADKARKAQERQVPFQMTLQILPEGASGEPRWVEVRSVPWRRDDETTVWTSAMVDVHDRVVSQEQLERFFSVNLDLLCIADSQGRFLKVNQEWERILGYAKAELEGRPFLDHVHPDDREKTIAATGRLAAGGQVINFTNRYRCRDGSYRIIEWRSHPHGPYVYAAARDVTERQREQDALEQMVRLSDRLFALNPEELDFGLITDDFRQLCGALVGAFNLYEEDGQSFRTVALAGNRSVIDQGLNVLGRNIQGALWPHDPARAEKISGRTTTVFSSLGELTGHALANPVIRTLEHTFRTGEVAVVKIMRDGRMLGDFTVIMKKDTPFDQQKLAEIFCNQLGLVLERQRAEARLADSLIQLQKSEEQQRTLVEEMQQGLALHEIICDGAGRPVDYRFLSVNPAYERLTGLSRHQLIGRSVREVLPDTEPQWIKRFGRVALTGESAQFEDYSAALDRHFRVHAYRPRDRQFAVLVEDITQQRRAAELIRESERKYRFLVDNISDVVWTMDLDLNTTYVSPAIEKLTGDSPEVYLKRTLEEKHPPESLRIIREQLRRSLGESGTSGDDSAAWTGSLEIGHYTAGGEILWLEVQVSFIRDEADRPVGILGVARDITERKAMAERLYIEKEQFRTTLLSVGDGIIATDTSGRITVMNPIAEGLTGWSQTGAAGRDLEEVFAIVGRADRRPGPNPAREVLATGKPFELKTDTILIARDGREHVIEDSAAPIRDSAGKVTGVVIAFRDCTERDRRQQQIEFLSFHDHLTGLYNRRYMEDALARLDVKRNLPFAYMVVDVNGLKLTNDAFGHARGDALLKRVTELLRSVCRQDDIIGRVGGDEFALLLPGTDAEEAEGIKRRILGAVNRETLGPVIISVAVGYAVKDRPTQDTEDMKISAENHMYKDKLKHGKTMRSQTIETVIRSINSKYDREQIHTERVSQYCDLIARGMGLGQREVDDIRTAGVLHDIGKIMIPPEILNKPGRLSDKEMKLVRQHPETGYQILRSVDEYASLAEMVLFHHEWWDGRGYPQELQGEDIPLGARIIGVADAFEAMTALRSYQKTKSKEEAIRELVRCAGTQFDPAIVQVLADELHKGSV